MKNRTNAPNGGGGACNRIASYVERKNCEREHNYSKCRHYDAQEDCPDDDTIIVCGQATQQDSESCRKRNHSTKLNKVCSRGGNHIRIKYGQKTWIALFAFLCIAFGFLLAMTVTTALLSDSKTATGQITFDIIKSPTLTMGDELKLYYEQDANTSTTGTLTYGSTSSVGNAIASLGDMSLYVDKENKNASYYIKIAYDFSQAQGTVSFAQSKTYTFSTGSTTYWMSSMTKVSTNYFESTSQTTGNASSAVPTGNNYMLNVFTYLQDMSYTNDSTYSNTSIPFTIAIIVDNKSTCDTINRAQILIRGTLGVNYTRVTTPDGQTTTTGTYTVFWNDGTGWDHEVVNAYSLDYAIKNTRVYQATDYVDYYGIGTFMGKRNVTTSGKKKWNCFVYIADEWIEMTGCLGWYLCYADWYDDYMTANVALVYAVSYDDLSAISAATDEYTSDISEVEIGDPKYKCEFYLKNSRSGVVPNIESWTLTSSGLSKGCTITGYGSTCAMALKQALGNDLELDDVFGNCSGGKATYGEVRYTNELQGTVNQVIVKMFGLDRQEISNTTGVCTTVVDWMLLDGLTGTGSELPMALGNYTPIDDAGANTLTEVSLVFEENSFDSLPDYYKRYWQINN